MLERRSILLIGSNDRAGLAICRSLGRSGHRVSILRLHADKSAADASRFKQESFYLGEINPAVSAFAMRLADLIREKRFDYVLPVTDEACEVVYSDYPAIAALTKIVGPTPETYQIARNKHSILPISGRAGLLNPPGVLVEQGAVFEPPFLPCFIKPVFSANVRDDYLETFSVKKAATAEAFEAKLRDDLARVPLLVQSPVGGHGVGINFVAFEGRLLGIAVTVRIHEPPQGGGSSYRMSGKVSERMIAVAKSVSEELKWTGFMMIELKQDGDREYVMEFNTRPWGSISLAIYSGVDLPLLLLNAFESPNVSAPLVLPTRHVYARYFRRDLQWLARELRKRTGVKAAAGWVGSLGRVFIGKERWDVEWLSDPVPGIAQYREPVAALAQKVRRKLAKRPAREPADVTSAALQSSPVVFVCRGNINRSAAAEYMLRAKGRMDVSSASLMATANRRASRFAEEYLAEMGIKADTHRSRPIDTVIAREDPRTIYVVFEGAQVAEMVRRFPAVRHRVILISDIETPTGGSDIPDPHGAKPEEYRICFDRIRGLIDRIGGN